MRNSVNSIVALVALMLGVGYAFMNTPNRAEIMGSDRVSFDPTRFVNDLVGQYQQDPVTTTVLFLAMVVLVYLLWLRR